MEETKLRLDLVKAARLDSESAAHTGQRGSAYPGARIPRLFRKLKAGFPRIQKIEEFLGRSSGVSVVNSSLPSSQPFARFLSVAIFLLPAATTAISFDLDYHDLRWVYLRVPLLLALSFSIFRYHRGHAPFFFHLLFFSAFSYFALQCMYPYADRYIQYGVNKSLDVLSFFPDRHLYTTYHALDSNYPSDHRSLAYKYWEFPYSPLALLPALYSLGLNVHPAVPLLLLQAIVAFTCFRLNSGMWAQVASSLMLVSPIPLLVMNAFYLNNGVLVPIGVSLIILSYVVRRHNPFVSGFILGLAPLLIQPLFVIWSFAVIAFVRARAVWSLIVAVVVLSCTTGYFLVQNAFAFVSNVITANSPSYLDFHMYLAGEPIKGFSMMGVLSKYFHFSGDWLVAYYPGQVLAALAGAGLWVFALVRSKHSSLVDNLKLGSLAFIVMAFLMKYSWFSLHYYLAPAITFLISDPLWKAERDLGSRSKVRIIFVSLVAAHFLLYLVLIVLTGSAFEFPPNTERCFYFDGSPRTNCIPLDLADAATPNPTLRLKAGQSSGWVNSQFGHQFWVLTPPGRYLTTVCTKSGFCRSEEDLVVGNRSLGLHIPFMVDPSDRASATVTKGMPSDIGMGRGKLILPNVSHFSVRRIQ